MDERNLKQDDDSFCSSVLMSTDNPEWQPLQKEMDRFDFGLSSSSDLQQETTFLEQGSDIVFEELEHVGKLPSNSGTPAELLQFDKKNSDRALRTLKHLSVPTFVTDTGFQMDYMMDTIEPSSAGLERSFSASAVGHEEQLEPEMEQVAADKCHEFEDDHVSDSSLTLAANRSLDMSRSLTDRCCKMAKLAASNDELSSDRLSRKRTWKALSSDVPQYNSPKVAAKNLMPSTGERSSSPFTDQKNLPRAVVDLDHERNPKSALRYRVIQEIVETERKYCTCLWIVIIHFAESLSKSELLTENEINIIFPPCLRQIYAYHGEFFEHLEHRLANWTEFSTVADLFSHLIEADDCDLFAQYQTYVDVFPEALLCIQKLRRRNAELDKFVKDLESQSCCEGLDVGAYLLTPIQRIPRYVLLLKQLVKCTDDAHPDFILVDSCLSKLGDFLNRLNESIKQSMELISADAVPKPKRHFNLASMSFRANNATNTEGRQSLSLGRQKNSSPPKVNRISLDLSFLGLLKQRMQNGPKDKMVRSELCLLNLPDQRDPLPSDQLVTSTPLRLCPQSTSGGSKSILPRPFKVPKPKRKLEDEPCTNLTEDTTNKGFSSLNIPQSQGKTDKAAQGNGLRDFPLRVQVSRKAFLSKFRRRAKQELSDVSNNLTELAVCSENSADCDTMEDLCSKTCDKIAPCEHHIPPVKETVDESVWIKPSELVMISDPTFSSDSSKLSADSFAVQLSDASDRRSISSVSAYRTDNESSLQSPYQGVDVSARNEYIHTSSSIFRGFLPPKKLRRTDGSPKPEPKKMAEVKRKPSVKDVIKNFFIKRGGAKSKSRDQSRTSNS